MQLVDLSLADPAADLACDEALLDDCEASAQQECLRLWESTTYFVVVGLSNRIADEVHAQACREDRVPILRRCTGGGTVLQGPGCLNYSLVLDVTRRAELASLTETNRFIIGRHRALFSHLLGEPVEVRGCTDLAWRERKFSGNAQRRKRTHLLFHGTFLLGLDMDRMERYLAMPRRRPDYRLNRSHTEFLTTLPLGRTRIVEALREEWGAEAAACAWPESLTRRLVEEKYGTDAWNWRR